MCYCYSTVPFEDLFCTEMLDPTLKDHGNPLVAFSNFNNFLAKGPQAETKPAILLWQQNVPTSEQPCLVFNEMSTGSSCSGALLEDFLHSA